ncbi:MAG: hypothetical protein ACJ75B_00595 [Flavisolibacter sp.]
MALVIRQSIRYAKPLQPAFRYDMKYEDPEFTPKALMELDSEDPDVVCSALVAICLNSGNYNLSINSVHKTIISDNDQIKSLAIICVGHIARIWRKIPQDLVKVVEEVWLDKNKPLWGYADDAISDLEIFIKGYQKPR